MLTRTHRNGGEASLQEVAASWKKEEHDIHWSESESDKHAVELAKRLKDADTHSGPAHPDPRNIH
jgi:electron transfer flavoprotein alpha/beta subunit